MSHPSPLKINRASKRFVKVDGLSMAYLDLGFGDPIVFLHGNPTSSFLWRNVIPYAQEFGRCIAPDLIGMGDSDKLDHSGPDSYRFDEHRRYLEGLFVELGLHENIVFVVHDWGSALALDWARRHPQAVRGIVHMESIAAAMRWEEMPEAVRSRFESVRSPEGEELVLNQNIFIEQSIVRGTMRPFDEEEMTEYRRPYLEPGEGRRPMLSWPRELPIGGEPQEIVEMVESYAAWLATSEIPKLYIRAEPGTHSPRMMERIRSWPNQREVAVKGIHYPQEDSPDEIGAGLATWLGDLKAGAL